MFQVSFVYVVLVLFFSLGIIQITDMKEKRDYSAARCDYTQTEVHMNILHCMYRKFMVWKVQCFALQSMGPTNHKFPVYATVQVHLKSTVCPLILVTRITHTCGSEH